MADASQSRPRLRAMLQRLRRNNQVILLSLALVMGVAAGLAAIAFREGIDLTQRLAFGFGGERIAALASQLDWWHLLLAPALGGLGIGLFCHFFMRERRPEGVADVIYASAVKGGRMSLADGIKSAAVSAASIGVGASVGREGPVVHLGASLSGWLAGRLRLGRGLSRTLLGCGVASAVAASFNAPIAGCFFALEVVVGHYALSAFAPIVVASVAGTIISRMHYGNFPAFELPDHFEIVSFFEFPAFALLGLVSAAAAMLFMRTVIIAQDVIGRTPVPAWGRPALAGLIVGAIALEYPEVLGVGYEATDAALKDLYPLWFLLALIAVKTLATAICLGSGFGGGVFSPSLFIGAMVGGAYGIIATSVFPEFSSGHGAYTLIGMGAVAGAVLGAPISTILMMFELTGDYALTIAVMIATVVATTLTQQLHSQSLFHWQLERRGHPVHDSGEEAMLKQTQVGSVMNPDYRAISADASLEEVREALQTAPWGELFVVDEAGALVGLISYAELQETAFDRSHDDEWKAVTIARPNPAALARDEDLASAIPVFANSGEAHLPVVSDRKSMTLIGIAHEHRIMLAYHQALVQARAEERGEA